MQTEGKTPALHSLTPAPLPPHSWEVPASQPFEVEGCHTCFRKRSLSCCPRRVDTSNGFSTLTVSRVCAPRCEIHRRHQRALQKGRENHLIVQVNCYHKQIVTI